MIQAPQTSYVPQATGQNNNQPQVNQQPVQPAQQENPNVIYNYPTGSCYCQPNAAAKSQFNGVNIEIFNPQGVGQPGAVPATYVPVNNQQQPVAKEIPNTPASDAQTPAPVIENPPAQESQQDSPQAMTPAVDNQKAPDTSVTPEAFAGKLNSDDLDAQKSAIEEVAELVKDDNNAGPILLDEQIFDSLANIINKDTSKLQGPTPEVIELRQKDESKMTEEEKQKATTPSELEKAEINKQYALYTLSYMQERLNNELTKRNGQVLNLSELPCIETMIDTAKSNDNPMLREGAIFALSYIARPEYTEDLKTVFELAQKDKEPAVQEAATKALSKLTEVPNAGETAPQAQAAETKEGEKPQEKQEEKK